MKKNVLIGVIVSFIVILVVALVFVVYLINKNKTEKDHSVVIGTNNVLSDEEIDFILNSDEDIYLGSSNEIEDEDPDAYTLSEEEMTQRMEVVSDFDTYWQVSNYVSDYYSYYNGTIIDTSEESRAREMLFDILGAEFKAEKGIEDETDFKGFVTSEETFFIRKIMGCTTGDNATFYICEGIKTSGEVDTNYKVGVLEDYYTQHMCIYPNEFIQNHFKDIKEGSTIDFEFQDVPEIMATEYIEYDVDDYEVLDDLLGIYRACIQYDVEYAYNNYLDEDYKKEKFPALDDYKNYLRYNKDDELGFEISGGSKDIENNDDTETTIYHLQLNNGKNLDIKTTFPLEFSLKYVEE